MLGRIAWRKMGSNGGEHGERGMLSTKVAMRRGPSRSPVVDWMSSCAQRLVRNLVGVVNNKHRSTSSAGAFPAWAEAIASLMAWVTGSMGVEWIAKELPASD